jgi:hypothetical protein
MNQTDRRRWTQLQADRKAIDTAAAWLRERAWQGEYAGLHDKDRAFMIALLLDTLSLQADRIPPGVRAEAVRVSRWLVGKRGT